MTTPTTVEVKDALQWLEDQFELPEYYRVGWSWIPLYEQIDELNHIAGLLRDYDKLRKALSQIMADCQTTIDLYNQNGPERTSPAGSEFYSADFVLEKAREIIAHIRPWLASESSEEGQGFVERRTEESPDAD